jgi:murein DD-endopeptidase MepM/ murein hydrolase activator NlpD
MKINRPIAGLLVICWSMITGCSSLPESRGVHRLGMFDRSRSHSSDGQEWGAGDRNLELKWPLATVQVTSHYGRRGGRFHEGVDLRAKVGTAVRAAQTGRVIYASSSIRGYGQMVVIRHSTQLATIYAHNSRLLVKRGDVVKQGQEIAMSGNSGRSTGPHLHFEIRRNLAAVDPLRVLPTRQVADASDWSHRHLPVLASYRRQ